MWLYLFGRSDESLRTLRGREAPCGIRRTPGSSGGRAVALAGPGKPRAEAMREHDPGKPALDRWIRRVRACGSTAAADSRAPERNRLVELERGSVGFREAGPILS